MANVALRAGRSQQRFQWDLLSAPAIRTYEWLIHYFVIDYDRVMLAPKLKRRSVRLLKLIDATRIG
jgi:hypothetical protein